MSQKQKNVLLILLILSLLYFVIMAFPNNQGADDARLLSITSQDEGFQYPFLIRMLTPGESLKETLVHIISYHHYIYGYPFYIASALVSLPLKLIVGTDLASHTQLHLLILRQFISVLPMIAAILILVYLQTRFKSAWRAVVLFLLLALTPAIVRQSITWWHPDALAILFATLTFFFLDRDARKFGKNFYLAAIFCGLSAGTKLLGFFFVLVIAAYILITIRAKQISIQKALSLGLLFILVMVAALVISNPLLIPQKTRAGILSTHLSHNLSFRTGWDTPDVYTTDPLTWLPVIERWYAGVFFILFAFTSLLVSVFRGANRLLNFLILLFILPLASYLLAVIAVRPDHYWMPVFLLLFSASLGLISDDACFAFFSSRPGKVRLGIAVSIFGVLIIASQFSQNLQKVSALYTRAVNQQKLLYACDSTPINELDGTSHKLQLDTWYAVEEFNTQSHPPFRKFYAAPGSSFNNIAATEFEGLQVWACVDQDRAVFRSQFRANDYQLSNPNTVVTGPSESKIPK